MSYHDISFFCKYYELAGLYLFIFLGNDIKL